MSSSLFRLQSGGGAGLKEFGYWCLSFQELRRVFPQSLVFGFLLPPVTMTSSALYTHTRRLSEIISQMKFRSQNLSCIIRIQQYCNAWMTVLIACAVQKTKIFTEYLILATKIPLLESQWWESSPYRTHTLLVQWLPGQLHIHSFILLPIRHFFCCQSFIIMSAMKQTLSPNQEVWISANKRTAVLVFSLFLLNIPLIFHVLLSSSVKSSQTMKLSDKAICQSGIYNHLTATPSLNQQTR